MAHLVWGLDPRANKHNGGSAPREAHHIDRDDESIANDEREGHADGDDGIFESVKDHFQKIDERITILVHSHQHLKMLTIMAACNMAILCFGLVSTQLLVASNSVDDGNIDEGQVGLWSVTVGDASYSLCKDWPEDESVCGSVNAARAFFILSAIVEAVAIVIGMAAWVVEATEKKRKDEEEDRARENGEKKGCFAEWSDHQVVWILGSAILGLIAYAIWMGNCDKELARLLKNAVLEQADKPICSLPMPQFVGTPHDVLSCDDGSIYYYGTLGYSYGLLAWSWMFPLMLVLVKFGLPLLEFDHDKEMMRDLEDDGELNHSTA